MLTALLVYAASFIAFAAALLVIPWRRTGLSIASCARWLAGFAVLHGAAELLGVAAHAGGGAPAVHTALVVASFFVLAEFAVCALSSTGVRAGAARALPLAGLAAVCGLAAGAADRAATADAAARAIFAAPAAIAAAVALLRQSRELRVKGDAASSRALVFAAVPLALYGPFAAVPATGSLGFAVIAARSACAAALAVAAIRLTRSIVVFQADTSARLAAANEALARETEERCCAEDAARRAEHLASLGQLAAGVGHEINNPLSYVIANLDYVALACPGPREAPAAADLDELRAAVSEAREGAERVRVIVRDLRALAHGDDEKIAPLDVRQVIDSAANIAMNEIKHRARLVRDFAAVPPVDANDVRLGQVFLNLLVNAAHAVPEGDSAGNEIRVSTRTVAGGRVEIAIRDTGAGIPPEHLHRLFHPFFTTKPAGKGTGLGLWICHGIVTRFGGELDVQSEVGKGTTVRILLPRSKSAGAEPAQPAAAPLPPPAQGRTRVLVVDDEPMVGRCIQRLLAGSCDVAVETAAREALGRVEREGFDAILCDVMMPEMSGADFYEELGRRKPELQKKVVFLTGGVFTPGATRFMARAGRPRLDKPFDAQKLRTALLEVAAAA